MKKIKLRIQYEEDRNNVIIALANNGYAAIVEIEEDNVHNKTYYVVFEI